MALALPSRSEGLSAVLSDHDVCPVELSILMPCLNEAETLESCIAKKYVASRSP